MRLFERRDRRRLNEAQTWELALFVAMFTVGALLLAVVLRHEKLPRLFAFAFTTVPGPTVDVVPHEEPAVASEMEEDEADAPSVANEKVTPAKGTEKPKVVAKPAREIRYYNGKKYEYVRTLRMRVTAYAPDYRCTKPYPGTHTASGLSVKTNGGRLVATDPHVVPTHWLVAVPGYAGGQAVPALDTGGRIKGHSVDVLLPTFDQAQDWGAQLLEVKVYRPVK